MWRRRLGYRIREAATIDHQITPPLLFLSHITGFSRLVNSIADIFCSSYSSRWQDPEPGDGEEEEEKKKKDAKKENAKKEGKEENNKDAKEEKK